MVVEGVSSSQVVRAENVSPNASKLAVNLLTVLFTQEQLATGNCTKPNRSDIELLDQHKVEAIRCIIYNNCIITYKVMVFL